MAESDQTPTFTRDAMRAWLVLVVRDERQPYANRRRAWLLLHPRPISRGPFDMENMPWMHGGEIPQVGSRRGGSFMRTTIEYSGVFDWGRKAGRR